MISLIYILLALYVAKRTYDIFKQIDVSYGVKEKEAKIILENTLVNNIEEFKKKNETSDKSELIKHFIEGDKNDRKIS